MSGPHAVLISALFVGVVASSGVARAQTQGEFHQFTDKRGQKVTAMLVSVSQDRRQMRIVREDGQAFDTEIVLLSLDDQQYVKDWEKTVSAPAAASGTAVVGTPSATPATAMPGSLSMGANFRLEVAISRIPGEERKNRDDFYTMEEKSNLFRITVKNLSRESLVKARLDYAVVWKDAVTVYHDKENDEWDFRSHPSDEAPEQVKKLGGSEMSDLRFNDETIVESAPISFDRVLYDGNQLYREDELVGVKVRILAPDGSVLHEADSGGSDIAAMTWEEIAALDEPRVID